MRWTPRSPVHRETHAPHLVPYIADLMRSLPERSDELVRIVLLLDALPTAEMQVAGREDLPLGPG